MLLKLILLRLVVYGLIIESLDQNQLHPSTPTWSSSDPPNQGMPGSIPGIKVGANNANTFYFWFYTNRSPVWGNFYARDGFDKPRGSPGEWVYAYNRGFIALYSNDTRYFIAVPDTYTPPIPEPGTLILIGFGLIGIADMAVGSDLAGRRDSGSQKNKKAECL